MEISEMIEDIKGGVVRFKEQAARNEAAIKELQGRAVNRSNAFDAALKEAILENYEKLNHIEKYRRVDFRVKAASDMTFTANFANADNSITQVKPGIVPLPNRKVHIRELLPAGTMGTSDFAFVRETGKDGDVSVWQISDGNKSQFDINFTEATAPSEYIAGFLVIGRKMLDDVAGLTSFLQGRLLQMYLNAEDTELLTGNGTSPHLSGLITNAIASTSTATNDYDQLLDALAQLEGSNYNPTGILINPATYYKIAQYKASTSGLYDKPGIVIMQNGQLYFNGVPVYKSTAMNIQSYLVGDFAMGAQLMEREEPRVEFFEQDNTNVRQNKITVRIEGRVAFPIYATAAFITGTFASY